MTVQINVQAGPDLCLCSLLTTNSGYLAEKAHMILENILDVTMFFMS